MESGKPDRKLIQACIKGRPQAWNEFVRLFSGLVMWAIKERLGRTGYFFSDSDIEDIHQEVFLRLYSGKLQQLKEISKIAGWLCVVSGNAAISYMRQKGRLAEGSVSLYEALQPGDSPGASFADILQSARPGVHEQVDKNLAKEALDNAIKSLNPKERLVLNLYYVCENTVKEIADNLGLAQGTVASIIARSREKLKEKLKIF